MNARFLALSDIDGRVGVISLDGVSSVSQLREKIETCIASEKDCDVLEILDPDNALDTMLKYAHAAEHDFQVRTSNDPEDTDVYFINNVTVY